MQNIIFFYGKKVTNMQESTLWLKNLIPFREAAVARARLTLADDTSASSGTYMAPTRSWMLISGWSCATCFGVIISQGIPITLPQNRRNIPSLVLQESWCKLKMCCVSCSYVLQRRSNAFQRDKSILRLSQWNRACPRVPYNNDQSQVRFGQDLELLLISDPLL